MPAHHSGSQPARVLPPPTALTRRSKPKKNSSLRRSRPSDQDGRKARSVRVLTRTCPSTRWACATIATTSTAGAPWRPIARTRVSALSTPRASVRAVTSMTTTKCAAASASSRKSKKCRRRSPRPQSWDKIQSDDTSPELATPRFV